MGTDIGLEKSSKNLNFVGEGLLGCSTKGKEVSSKITWHDMILLETMSRQWYLLC
jgi:hypothetical protein